MSEVPAVPGVFINEPMSTVHSIVGVSTAETAFVDVFPEGPLNAATRVLSFVEFEAQFGGLDADSEASYGVQQFFLNGGMAAWIVRVPDASTDNLIGSETDNTGIFALNLTAPAMFNLLCIPATANLPDTNTVIAAAAEYCRSKRAFFLADIPPNITTPDAALTWKKSNTGPWASSAAVYFPRLEITDALNPTRSRNIGSSGSLAGIYAQTDRTRGVWKPPAGIQTIIQGAVAAVNVFDVQIAKLNAEGINVLRNDPGRGFVAWAARTMDGADDRNSEWKYVPVRRTVLFIEESVQQGLQWAVFEPNDEPLWQSIRLTVEAFLHDLFLQGAFQGAKPEEAYFVRCGRETTTQSDLDNGMVNVVVGFAPLKPAEFVIISIRQITGSGDNP